MGFIATCSKYASNAAFATNTRNSLFYVGVINSVLAVPTAAANALVIVAILTTSSLQTPSYLLLTSLAVSDLVVGLGQALYSVLMFTLYGGQVKEFCHFLIAYFVLSSWTSWASIFTITAISVDRYLAIRLKMRYRTVVTVSRTRRLLVIIWILSFATMVSPIVFEFRVATFGIVNCVSHTGCLVVILFCYTKSFRALKIHCAQILPQGNQQPNNATQSNAIDVLKYRKLLKTMVMIVVVIFVCYLPVVGVLSTMSAAPGSYKSQEFAKYVDSIGLSIIPGLVCFIFLNSTVNPVIYMTRMSDLRLACVQVLKNTWKCFS